MKYEKEFRQDHPETVGEKDKNYDRSNYIDWIDAKYSESKLKSMVSSSDVSDQRELLIEFAEFYGSSNSETRHERIVDNFLKGEKFKQ